MKPRSLNKILEMNEKRNSKQYYWKDGYSKDTRGYISIYYPEHPFNKGRKTKSIRRSRLIMEEYLERYLTTYEYVHHDNEIITDDRIENLKLMTPAEHQRIHHIGKKASDETKAKMSIAGKRIAKNRNRDKKGRFTKIYIF